MKKLRVSISKLIHRGDTFIKVAIPNTSTAKQFIKKVNGYRYSKTKQCWYVPNTDSTIKELQKYFDLKVEKEIVGSPPLSSKNSTTVDNSIATKDFIRVENENNSRVRVFIPWQKKDWITSIKELPNRAWNIEHKYWSLPKNNETLNALKQLFSNHLQISETIQWLPKNTLQPPSKHITTAIQSPLTMMSIADLETLLQTKRKENATSPKQQITSHSYTNLTENKRAFKAVTGAKIIIEKENQQWLKVYVPYDKKGWIEVVKQINGRKWNVEEKYWIIPYVKDSLKRLSKLIGQQYIHLCFEVNPNIPAEFKIQKPSNRKPPKFKLNEVQQKAFIAFEQKMMLENKAWRTIKTYKGLFKHFLAYFPDTRPSLISKDQIEQYVIYKKQDNVSDSQLNQLINCLNCFFIRILKQKDKVVKLERPRKKKKLPNVFSLEEIERLLKGCENLKHKCMLILIYSGGLRKGELLDLRVDDLHFERKTIFLKNAKGGKDRYTFFADSARKYVLEYLKQYAPKYYLFEGQTRGRYSETSLQNVYEKARKLAKLKQNVTLHGLRHSFATHLIEKRVPLHVVQDLLGHYSIKTTEVYLHISNKFRKELKSPLDDMKL